MPAIAPNDLASAITNAIAESGYVAHLASPSRRQPRRFVVAGPQASLSLTVYCWTLTFGGRPSLQDEFRIQMTSVHSPLELAQEGPTILIGYEPALNMFAGFDLQRHRVFTTGSPSIQIDINALHEAEREGLSFHRKSNDEIAIGIRPNMFMAYALNASTLHRFGRDANTLRLLNQAVRQSAPPQQTGALTTERQRIVREVNRLSRDAAFRQRVMFAYGNRCAVTRTQLQLVDAAHILPVGVNGSTDIVQNGIALSPTYHRAFDAGLIYLTENCEMRVNSAAVDSLRRLNFAGGLDLFCQHLGPIFLPPDPNQHPSSEFIRRANRARQISL